MRVHVLILKGIVFILRHSYPIPTLLEYEAWEWGFEVLKCEYLRMKFEINKGEALHTPFWYEIWD